MDTNCIGVERCAYALQNKHGYCTDNIGGECIDRALAERYPDDPTALLADDWAAIEALPPDDLARVAPEEVENGN